MNGRDIVELRKSMNLKQLDFCKKIEISQSYLSEIEKEKKPVTDDLYNKIANIFGNDAIFAIINQERADKTISVAQSSVSDSTRKGALIYDIDATCGTDSREIEFTDERIIGSIDAPEINSSSQIIFATGDSMQPLISSGDRIVIRKIESWDFFNYGQIYLIITNEYRLIKRVKKWTEDEENYILLKSENPEHDDFKLHRSKIVHLYLVENILSIKSL